MKPLTLALPLQFKAHSGSVYTLCADKEKNIFLSAGGDGSVIRWSLADLENPVRIARVQSNIFSLAVIPDPGRLLVGQMQGGLHVIDLKEKKEIRHLAWHTGGIFDIQQDEQHVFLAGGDGRLSVWSRKDLSPVKLVDVAAKSLRAIAFHPGQPVIAIGASDHRIYLVEMKNFSVFEALEGHENSVFSVAFSPDGRYLLSGSRDAHLRVWDAQAGYASLQAIPAHNYTINHIAFHPSGKVVATASRDRSIKLWDANDLSFLLKIHGQGAHTGSVNRLLWMDTSLVSCSDDRSVMVREVK